MRTDEPRSVEQLCEAIAEGWAPEYLFFWKHGSRAGGIGPECLSQWYPAGFVVDGERFATAEHFMMYRKALLFDDEGVAERILGVDHPRAVKKLGRRTRGFDEERWVAHRFDIVVAGSLAKFSQNPGLRAFLCGTSPRVLVEASPLDAIWGIGLAEEDPAARHPARWRGLNLLGFALMKARAELRARYAPA